MLIALFSQYMTNVKIPVPAYAKDRGGCYIGRYPLFQLFPVSMYENFENKRIKGTSLVLQMFSISHKNLVPSPSLSPLRVQSCFQPLTEKKTP